MTSIIALKEPLCLLFWLTYLLTYCKKLYISTDDYEIRIA